MFGHSEKSDKRLLREVAKQKAQLARWVSKKSSWIWRDMADSFGYKGLDSHEVRLWMLGFSLLSWEDIEAEFRRSLDPHCDFVISVSYVWAVFLPFGDRIVVSFKPRKKP
jgi:hypothetical protein